MTRFAIQCPNMLMGLPDTDFNGARQEFIRRFKPVIFMPNFKWWLTRGRGFKKYLKQSPLINPDEFEFAFSVGELNRKADVLVHFNQYPVDLESLAPPRGFRGLKVWHIFEIVFHTGAINRLLEENGVDYVLGYTDHGRHCPFFQKYYPKFVERVIPMPFGTSKRFLVDVPWENRKQKIIALGSVNLVNEPGMAPDALKEYAAFYSHLRFTHEWRRKLVEHETELTAIMDSQLPHYPEMKNLKYDAVKMMTDYALFTNDEGLLAFPPARTYEGPAAGAAMIASDFEGYADLGFRDGVDYIAHRKHDIADYREKATYYLNRPAALRRIAEAGQKLVRTHHTHEAIATRLANQLEVAFTTGRRPETRIVTNAAN